MIRCNVPKEVGKYLTKLIDMELLYVGIRIRQHRRKSNLTQSGKKMSRMGPNAEATDAELPGSYPP
jgi:hypothetical protein